MTSGLKFVSAILISTPLLGAPPITLEIAKKADGSDWINLADPAGIINQEEGITDTESAVFDPFDRLIVTCSKADGRHPSPNHGKSSQVMLWNAATGEKIWDRKRSREPDHDGDGRPDDQPKNGEDELEITLFSPDGRFVAAGAEDDAVEVWRVRLDSHGPDEWLPEPILETTFTTGDGDKNTDDAGIDSMNWSAEAFNEPTGVANRWSLIGSRSEEVVDLKTTNGSAEWGSSAAVIHTTPFRGHRGRHYLAVGNLGGETHSLELNQTWDLEGFEDLTLQFSAVAAPGVFESGDFLRLKADCNGDGAFDTTIVEFLPDHDGDLALGGEGGRKLNAIFLDDDGVTEFFTFEDFYLDLDPLLKGDSIRFQIEAKTDAANEEIGFDNLRISGTKEHS